MTLYEDLIVFGLIQSAAPTGGGSYGFQIGAGAVANVNVAAGGPGLGIAASKLEHVHRAVTTQLSGTAIVTQTTLVYNVRGTNATLTEFMAQVLTACIGAATVTFDLKKNGTSMLSAVISFGSGDAANAIKTATLTTTALAKGDRLEVVVTATAGGGTVGQGAIAIASMDEDYN